jgi:hypothetical protein
MLNLKLLNGIDPCPLAEKAQTIAGLSIRRWIVTAQAIAQWYDEMTRLTPAADPL